MLADLTIRTEFHQFVIGVHYFQGGGFMKTNIILTMIIAGVMSAVDAQEIAEEQNNRLRDSDARSEPQAYSQAENISNDLSLDLMALNNPAIFEGLAVLDSGSQEIATIAAITRARDDQSLHAIINLSTGTRAALPLAELSLAAFAYYDPVQSLSDQPYVPAEFEQISQYQAGHSARGSLSDPVAGSTATQLPRDDPDQATEPVGLPQQPTIEQQTQVDSVQLQTPAQTPTSNDSAAEVAYIASGSPIVQLALIRPDALRAKQLLDETGEPLGEISHIAKNVANQDLYAVIDMNTQHGQTAVKLDALSIAKVTYLGDTSKLMHGDFNEEDFVPIAGH